MKVTQWPAFTTFGINSYVLVARPAPRMCIAYLRYVWETVTNEMWRSHGDEEVDVGFLVWRRSQYVSTCKSTRRYNPDDQHRQAVISGKVIESWLYVYVGLCEVYLQELTTERRVAMDDWF
jgi:hypothetical protein